MSKSKEPIIRRRQITDYHPDPNNPNQGTERGWRVINDSFREDGAGRSIVVAADDTIVAGNHATENAVDVGITSVIEIETDGTQLVVVKRKDWQSATDPQARRYAIRDNRSGELSLNWNAEQLLADINNQVIDLETIDSMFTEQEITDLINNAIAAGQSEETPAGDAGAQLNRAEELREFYGVERGQVWQVGVHRLMCGDAYSEDDRARLLNGQSPDLAHFDPPYGINIVQPRHGAIRATDGGAKPFGGTSGTERKSGIAERNASRAEHIHVQHGKPSKNQIIQSNLYPVMQGDDRPFDPKPFLDVAPIVILWGAINFADQLPLSQGWIVWDKREDITRNTFADCELAWSNRNSPARLFHHLWNGLHKGSQHGERRTHPTEKPVALFAEIGKMVCPKGLWLDLFAGTGAQMVAAQQCGTICYAMEWESLYVAVTLDRLAQLNLEPRLV